VDTLAALSTGAYVLSESYLYTTQAIHEFLDHLNRGGFLSIMVADFAVPLGYPRHTMRQLSLFIQALKERGGSATDLEDAAGLRVLASIRSGETGSDTDTRREQIRKFSRWSVAARLDWLLAAARLALGLSPEARPMTRGLVRRHWRRDGR
jgi:hypothetical protein